MRQYVEFYSYLRYLRSNLDLPYPMQVRRVENLPDNIDGDCCFKNDRFYIRIRKSLPEYYAIDVLTHEVGHCLAWNASGIEHGPSWGLAYSKVYRTFLEWIEKDNN